MTIDNIPGDYKSYTDIDDIQNYLDAANPIHGKTLRTYIKETLDMINVRDNYILLLEERNLEYIKALTFVRTHVQDCNLEPIAPPENLKKTEDALIVTQIDSLYDE